MDGRAKAAALLVSLGPSAEAVLRRLPEEQAQTLRQAMQELSHSPQLLHWQQRAWQELDELLRQVETSASSAPSSSQPTAPTPSVPATEPASTENLAQLRARLLAALQGQEEPLPVLREIPSALLSAALADEQPRTIALVLQQLRPAEAAEVLRRLPPESRREASLRLAQLQPPSPDVMRTLQLAVLSKVARLTENPELALSDQQVERTAKLLRQLDRQDRKEIFEALERSDAALAQRIKELLYRLEDILRLQDRSVQKVLAEVDSRTLALAVKGASQEVREKITRNLSRRAREALQEEMEFLGSVGQTQIRQAQRQLIEVLQRLDLAGELAYEEE
ncbi:MAG: FliG C-terminal domain-containing protein [Gemmatales bacterium]|nr:hypothetical protein [Gemmatales bacterium]MDW7995826.1 FliG C-terminal domain-containing protein [Gemmatales bacterium]